MPKLGAVLKTQFTKLGIEITDDLKPLVELDTEVSVELASKIDKGLLTVEAAKTNTDVIKALRQSTLAGADTKMDDIIKEMGLTVGEDFVNEKNTYTKIEMLSKMLHEAGKKKGEGNQKEGVSEVLKKERDTWNQKEADYQKQLKNALDGKTSMETEFKTTRENDLTSFELQKKLFGKDYVFPKDMDSSIKVQTALNALNKDLLTRGLVAKLDAAGTLVITDKDGNKAYNEKHEPIENADTYIDAVLTHNKLLNINDPNVQQPITPGSGGAPIIPSGGANKNAAIVNEIDAQLKSIG